MLFRSLKKLGVNYVQIMPMYDYGSVDESGEIPGFNWGYDPVNYNVPEGSYSTDPYHGEVRIKELKEMVQSLHKNGFRVIMDVVYNHTYSLESWFQKTAPWYFYRVWEDGSISNMMWQASEPCVPNIFWSRCCTGQKNITLTASDLT